ncbi:DUF5804 family protein [Haloquadratum walsbyi]|uniref:Uncharacterized protein n=1 Tax=Haloquadratum walsbyi J07HQW2 TaxID=1238425 RepID=U1NDG4_9EURY|nr:DUF5804 family protein [Haloquadratum walsbyi]ERG94773.1 MAG: hypothetical protein J07HQW2_01215 [Haloquadratum walsbyi J07HQW2]
MTVVCFLGEQGTDVQYELLSRETAREALITYSFAEPFRNSLAVETVSLGAAVSLCNDLEWYLVRFVDQTIIREPSITDNEWLSRPLATAVRDEKISPAETGERLAIYGVVDESLVEPMYVTRRYKNADNSDKTLPSYDLRQVNQTVVVRITANEFGEC